MKLSEIFSLSFSANGCRYDADVFGLSFNSGNIKSGDVFVAVRGVNTDGIKFAPVAVERGAVAIVYDVRSVVPTGLADICKRKNVPMFCVSNAEIEASRIASLVYPNAPEFIIAVTGTNGKTTIAHFTEQLLNSIGINETATIGTMGMGSGDKRFSRVIADVNAVIGVNPLTTQDTIVMHKILDMSGRAGIKYLIMEASSDGIVRHRLEGINFAACGITNVSADHLITHGSVENYLAAKVSLFDKLPSSGVAVFNADDKYSQNFRNHVEVIGAQKNLRVIEYGRNVSRETFGIKLLSADYKNGGYDLRLKVFGKAFDARLGLFGEFQIYNALHALGFVLGCVPNADVADVLRGFANLKTINGRMELVATTPSGADVYIDYAHNVEALKNALQQLRTITKGRLISVSGISSGKAEERNDTARVAGELADIVIFTYLSPKSEPANVMIAKQQAIFPAGLHGGQTRYDAIKKAIDMAQAGDVILINGQGHERFIVEDGVAVPFYDADAVCEIIAKCR